METPNACFDLPSERDWNYGLFWAEEIPEYVNLAENVTVQDQWIKNDPSTSMACVFYAMTHWVNANNMFDDWNVLLKGNEERAKFINDPVWIEWYDNQWIDRLKQGSYIQHWAEFAKERWYISAYFLCNSNELKRQALASFRSVHTGSSRIDWKATKNNNAIAVEGDGAAHSIEIVWYDLDKEWFIAINSWWDDWWDDWFFYVPFSIAEKVFFSAYALVDMDDKPLIDAMIAARDKIIEIAKQKIKDGIKLKVREKIALRSWGYGHLIPKNEA